jgi:hypothetical protein
MKTTLSLLVLLALAVPAVAAEDGALSLSPAVVMLRGDFGQSTTQTLTLRNGTSRPFSFDLVAQDVVTAGGKRTFVDAGSIAGSIAATAVFSQNHVDVAPGETVSVTMTVTLPPTTQQRAIVATFRGTNRVMSGDVPMKASLGALLTFSVSDSVELTAAPLAVRAQTASSSLGVAQACTNSGTEPLVAKGVLAVIDSRGALVGKAALDARRLLPGESTQIAGEYGGDLESGRYRVLVTYDYEGRTLTQSAEVEIR